MCAPLDLHVSLRNVAQFGSAPALGAGCRGFKSRHSDWVNRKKLVRGMGFLPHRSYCQYLWTHRVAGDRMSMVSGCGLMAEHLEKQEDKVRFLEGQPNFLGSVCRAAKATDSRAKFGCYAAVEAGHCSGWNPGTHRYLQQYGGDADDGERDLIL